MSLRGGLGVPRYSALRSGSVLRVNAPLSILTVHAHPDDESSKGAGTLAKYSDAGHHTVLVCCTGGEEGDILNPVLDKPEIRQNMAEVRRQELIEATSIIGFSKVHWLGYRDSGMPEDEANARPDNFANAPHDEAVERLVRIIRAEKPHVLVTYPEEQKGYQHPDHLRVYDITAPAWDLAGDPNAFPDAGDPWTPLKLYYSAWSRKRITLMHEKFLELGMESPYDKRWFERPDEDHSITTSIDINGFYHRRVGALRAHATQVDPESPFWFGLPDEVAATVYPQEDFVLAASRVPTTTPETDLFAGIEAHLSVSR